MVSDQQNGFMHVDKKETTGTLHPWLTILRQNQTLSTPICVYKIMTCRQNFQQHHTWILRGDLNRSAAFV